MAKQYAKEYEAQINLFFLLNLILSNLKSFGYKICHNISTEDTSVDTGELFDDLKEKWDKVENKTTVILYGGGAIVFVWLSFIFVGAINSVPLSLLEKLLDINDAMGKCATSITSTTLVTQKLACMVTASRRTNVHSRNIAQKM
ncbi:hypothetical protein Gohar_021833 [Gossypium harknessii]|uniref:Cyanobacterial aminoacyl-tRNA synthetase CAAD domain-containing protein n=1 Tax=Gossypium harknessii TaxID=34285 RepID=A0A7J9I7T9_9ROSI|nr:hypothetical protein [Gossypium harknessii]